MSGVTFGLFLNCGAQLGATHADVFTLTLEQARLAEELGYRDVWVSEHHFIDFGVNPSAITLAAFLLGRTERLRVGTAVTLAPQYHPVQLAEQAALLDQLSGGRFDFGIGRGGYVRDFEVFGVPTTRWTDEIEETARALLSCWSGDDAAFDGGWARFEKLSLRPHSLTCPYPPLFLATSTPSAIALAAERGLPLLHYFATPPEARAKVEATYEATGGAPGVPHVHTLPLVIADDEAAARAELTVAITESFMAGDHAHVPQASNRHAGPDGKPFKREDMAAAVAQSAIVGPVGRVVEQMESFLKATEAKRVVLYVEASADRARTLATIERFACEVRPMLGRDIPVWRCEPNAAYTGGAKGNSLSGGLE